MPTCRMGDLVCCFQWLLRDLLCRQKPWNGAVSVLRELCGNEGVPWRPSAAAAGGSTLTRTNGGSQGSVAPSLAPASKARVRSNHPKSGQPRYDNPGSRSHDPEEPPVLREWALRRAAIGRRAADRCGPRVPRWSGTMPGHRRSSPSGAYGRAGIWAATFPARRPAARPAALSIPPARRRECQCGSGRGAALRIRQPRRRAQPLRARSNARSAAGAVDCQRQGALPTRRFFKLPRVLDHLLAKVESPGLIRSPYAPAGSPAQRVPWEQWIPGGKIVCQFSAKPLNLPVELSLPCGILSPETLGAVISPYDRRTVVTRLPGGPGRGLLPGDADEFSFARHAAPAQRTGQSRESRVPGDAVRRDGDLVDRTRRVGRWTRGDLSRVPATADAAAGSRAVARRSHARRCFAALGDESLPAGSQRFRCFCRRRGSCGAVASLVRRP